MGTLFSCLSLLDKLLVILLKGSTFLRTLKVILKILPIPKTLLNFVSALELYVMLYTF